MSDAERRDKKTSMPQDPTQNRRPLASRNLSLVHRLVAVLLRTDITPNQISLSGIGFAALAALALVQAAPGYGPLRLTEHPMAAGFVLGAVFVQLRLLANLLDGLVAVEGRRGSSLGPLFNELPDRIEDTLVLVGFGWAAGMPDLGLWSALAAMGCAYTRLLGGTFGQPQSFAGPMAKQHRMAAVTLGCVLGAGELLLGRDPVLPGLLLWLVLIGTLVTIARRIRIIARRLDGAP